MLRNTYIFHLKLQSTCKNPKSSKNIEIPFKTQKIQQIHQNVMKNITNHAENVNPHETPKIYQQKTLKFHEMHRNPTKHTKTPAKKSKLVKNIKIFIKT